MPNPFQLQRVIYPAGALAGGASFVGALDGYAANLWHLSSGRRRLLSSWTGNLLTIRESAGSTEHDIAPLATGGLNVSAMESACGAANGLVVRRYDQSGNSRPLTQSTSSQQPKAVNAGSAIVDANSNPVALWDNTDDVLSVGGISPALNDVTVVVTAKLTAKDFFDMLVVLKNSSVEIRERGGEAGAQVVAGGSDVTDLVDTYPITSWRCWTAQISATAGTLKLWVNGNLIGSQTGLTIDPMDNLFLGGRDASGSVGWNGHISELAVFNSIIGDTQRVAVQNAFMEGMP